MMKILLWAALVGVMGVAVAQTGKIREATPDEVSLVRDAIAERLRDPDSARLSKVVVSTTPQVEGLYVMCGMVNAKNAFGGYAGNSWFYGMLAMKPDGSKVAIVLSVDPVNGPEVAAIQCQKDLFGS